MKKKFFAVLACALTLMVLCTMFAFAEETGGEGEMIWDFWSLLKPENVNYLQLLGILITTLVTTIRMFNGGGLKELWELLVKAVKNIIPSK